MTRRPNWPEILAAEVHLALHRHFAWGEHDCALMAADIVREMTGSDPMLAFRGRYKSSIGAHRLLIQLGGLERAITEQLGDPILISLAMRGDVVLFEDPPTIEPTAGICLGEQSIFPGPGGATFRATLDCKKAWSV